MKKNIKIIITLVIALILTILSFTQVEAATFTVSNSSVTLDVEKTTTIKIDASTHTGRINITSSDTNIATVNTASLWVENNSQTITISAKSAGNAKITISGELYDSATESEQTYTQTIDITVNKPKEDDPKQPITTPEPEPQPEPTPDPQPEPEPPVQQEPNFKNANKTMYASIDNMRLRATWSTDSEATPVNKGTELKVTATSTNKVNDYVWYKVLYNGKTYYVASNLLTDTKPAEDEPAEEPVDEPEPEEPTVTTEEPENDDTEVEAKTGLKSLEIEGQKLSPAFSPNVYEYRVIVKEDISELKINAIPAIEGASITIAGDKNLKEGENLITLMVYNEKNAVEATYQITVNKNTVDLSITDKLLQAGNSEATRNLIIFFAILAIAIIALIVVMSLRRRNQNYEENYEENAEESTENEQIVENISTEINPEEIIIENLQEEKPRPRQEKRKGKHF